MGPIEIQYEVFENIEELYSELRKAKHGYDKEDAWWDLSSPQVILGLLLSTIALVCSGIWLVFRPEVIGFFAVFAGMFGLFFDCISIPVVRRYVTTRRNNGWHNKHTEEEAALLRDPIVQFVGKVVAAEQEITDFIESWNDYVCRRDLGILEEDPELEKMGPVAQKAHDTMANILLMAREFVKIREERLERDERVTELHMASGIDIAEVLDSLTRAANDAQSYIKAYQETEGTTSCPLDAIARIETVQAELRGDIPESKKLKYLAAAAAKAHA